MNSTFRNITRALQEAAQAKQMLGATPDQQDDLLCANQQWFDHSPNEEASDERMLDPSGVQPGIAGSRF